MGMKLIVYCDYGLDDAAATYDALKNGKYDSYELVAVGGNVPPDISLKNAKKLLAALDYPLPKVRIVDTTTEEQPFEYLTEIHGGDGMGDLFAEGDVGVPVVPFSEWLNALEGEYDLLSLGPMSLVPPLLERVTPRKFVFMGGNVAEEPNFHGYEFNHALNRVAFSACVKYPHVAITMDTCRNPLLNVQNTPLIGKGMMGDIVNRSRELTFSSGEKGCYIWDDMAVKYLFHPEWFCLEEGRDKDGNLLTVARYRKQQTYSEIILQ